MTQLFTPRYRAYKQMCKHIPSKYALQLENSIYLYCKQYLFKRDISKSYFYKIYCSKVSEICFNLDQENSPWFIVKIVNKEIDINNIPNMKCTEMNPEKWVDIINKKEYAEYKRNNMATTFAYVCRRCKGNKHTTYSLQTRSCDEPMTIFVTCQTCKYEFRQ